MIIDLCSKIPHIDILIQEYKNFRIQLEYLVQNLDAVNPNHNTFLDAYNIRKKMDVLDTIIKQCIFPYNKHSDSAKIDTEETICFYLDDFNNRDYKVNIDLNVFKKNIYSALEGAGFRYRNIVLGVVSELDSMVLEILLNESYFRNNNYKYYFIYPVKRFMNSMQSNFLAEINKAHHVKEDSILYLASGNTSLNRMPEILKQIGRLHITYDANGKMSIF